MKNDNHLKTIFLKDSSNNILYVLAGLIVLCIICIYFVSPDTLSNGTQNDIEVLLVNAQILATIFAITTSFAILGLQYVSQDLTPRIMTYFIKSKEISIFFGCYVVGIITNLFVASFPKILNPSIFLFMSYIILVFCIFSLIIFLKFIVQGIQPITIIKNIEMNIPNNFDEKIIEREENHAAPFIVSNDPFIELEQILIRSIRNNDHASFLYCFQRIIILNYKYLKKIHKLPIDNGYKEVWRKTIHLQNYFLRLYNQILFEILNQNNECFLNEYIDRLFSLTTYLFELKCHHSIEPFERKYEEIGRVIIDRKYYQSSSNYLTAITNLINKKFSYLPSGNNSVVYSDDIPDIKLMSEKEKDLWYFGERIHDGFFSDLSYFVKFCDRVNFEEENRHIFFTLNYTVEKLLIESFKGKFNEKFRIWLIYSLFYTYLQIHEVSLKKNTNDGADLGRLLMDISHNPAEYNILPLRNHLIGFFKRMGELSLQYDDPTGISSIGIASRVLIHQYPSIVSELIDILIECSTKIRQSEGLKNITIQGMKQQFESIISQNKEKNVEINTKINTEIEKINNHSINKS